MVNLIKLFPAVFFIFFGAAGLWDIGSEIIRTKGKLSDEDFFSDLCAIIVCLGSITGGMAVIDMVISQ